MVAVQCLALGRPGFDHSELLRIAEDHDNLTLALASVNRSKSDRDAAGGQPENNGAWMPHRIVEVKRKYDLSVDPAERVYLDKLLNSGPDQINCESVSPSANQHRRITTRRTTHPAIIRYSNCTAMRRAGWRRGVSRNGGTYRNKWDDAERRTYQLNTARDRDKDGHDCER